ncbi:MAG: DegV family protein [Clostridia bacterium]
MNYEIWTDSSSNLTDELIISHNINILSLVFVVGEREFISYEKGEETNLQQFYELLRKKETLTTSCVNEQTAYDNFEQTLSEGKDLLYIGFSSALSKTFSACENAINRLKVKFPERKIIAVDTLGASLGEGLLVLYASRLRESGKSIDEVAKWLEDNKLKLCHYFTVDDLFYLFRGGRVQKSSYLIASILQIKPIMHMNDQGQLVAIGRVPGRKKSINTLAKLVANNIVNPKEQTICITHGDCIDDVNLLVTKLKELITVKEYIINYVDPVVGAHSGPGTIAIFFLADSRLPKEYNKQ